MIITHDTWKQLNLNDYGMLFIDGIPVNSECVGDAKIGVDGFVAVVDFVARVNRDTYEVDTRIIKGNVELQVKEGIDVDMVDNLGFDLKEEVFHDQKKITLVEK